MQTYDGLHLSLTTYRPHDAPRTVVPDAGHLSPLERDELVCDALVRLSRPRA